MITTQTLLSDVVYGTPSGNYDGSSQDWLSQSVTAVDYYQGRGAIQTVLITVTDFQGELEFEATLDSNSDSNSWVQVAQYTAESPASDLHSLTIQGNWAWMRVRTRNFQAGTINQIQVRY